MYLKHLLLTAFCFLAGFNAWAYDFQKDGIYYDITDAVAKTVEVAYGENQYTGSISVPATVENEAITYNVATIGEMAFANSELLISVSLPSNLKSIDDYAFQSCTGLTSISFPSSLTSIGSSSFQGCTGLASISFPGSLTNIGYSSFYGCSGLTSVTIPGSLTQIGDRSFNNCSSLTSFEVNSGNNSYKSIDGVIYDKSGNILVMFPAGRSGSFSVPSGVASIGSYAFGQCAGLTSVTIPEGVTEIREGAFMTCTELTSISLPSSLKSIGNSVFWYCTKLPAINLPEGLVSIGDSAFGSCSKLSSVSIPESVANIGYNAFSGTIWYNNQPDGLIYINKVLYKYKGTMPVNTSITVLEGTSAVSGYAFYNFANLAAISFPNSLTSIGERAFSDCAGLSTISVPESVTSIGSYAFSGTTWYGNQPDGVIYINKVLYTYKGDIPANTSFKIKKGTLSISGNAFFYKVGLVSVTIPENVTTIGDGAFYDSGLADIYVLAQTPPKCNYITFNGWMSNIYSNAILHVPVGTKAAYQAADTWKEFVNIVEDATSPDYTNLLINPGAEDNFDGWTKTNGGSGWIINTGLVRNGTNSWMGSYTMGTLSQTVDLTSKGYPASTMDNVPDIEIGAYVAAGFENKGYVTIKTELLGADGNTLSTHYACNNELIEDNTPWTEKALTIQNYGTGVRSVKFSIEVRDGRSWLGNFSPVIDDAFVYISADVTTANESPQSPKTKVFGNDKTIVVQGAGKDSQLLIYDITGRKLVDSQTTKTVETFPVGKAGLYIVCVGEEKFKVLVK
ncbi:MAG: leucine-rich repeat protein [Breznakibacter sp.]